MRTHDLAPQEATADRRVGNDRDTKLARSFKETDLLVFDVEREGGILNLNRAYGVHRVRAPEGFGRNFGEAEVLDLARSANAEGSV